MKLKLGLLIAIIATFLLSACSDNSNDPKKAAEKLDTIKIGVLAPLSGSGESVGEASQAALDYKLELLKQRLAEERPELSLEFVFADTETDPQTARSQIERLYSERGIFAFVGPYSSECLLEVSEFAADKAILIVSPASIIPDLSLPNDRIYRFIPGIEPQAELIAKIMAEQNIDFFAAAVRDDRFGNDLYGLTAEEFDKLGGYSALANKYSTNRPNYSDAAYELDRRVRDYRDVMPEAKQAAFIATYGEGADILREASEYAALNEISWYGCSGFAGSKSLIQDAIAAQFAADRNLLCPNYALDKDFSDVYEPIMQAVEAEIGREPDIFSIIAVDAVEILFNTFLQFENVPTIDEFETLFLLQTAAFSGATGTIDLDANGDRTGGDFDIWGIGIDGGYKWVRVGYYDSDTDKILWID